MPRTIEGIVAAHLAGAERRAANRPVWDHKVVALRYEDGSFEENRDEFAEALERSRWFKGMEPGDELWDLWDEIKDAETVEHFDHVLDAIYDLADEERVWIEFREVEGVPERGSADT